MKIYELVYFEDGQRYSCFTTDKDKLLNLSKDWKDEGMEIKYDKINELTFDDLEGFLKFINEVMAHYDSSTTRNPWYEANSLV